MILKTMLSINEHTKEYIYRLQFFFCVYFTVNNGELLLILIPCKAPSHVVDS